MAIWLTNRSNDPVIDIRGISGKGALDVSHQEVVFIIVSEMSDTPSPAAEGVNDLVGMTFLATKPGQIYSISDTRLLLDSMIARSLGGRGGIRFKTISFVT